jgi:cephalosporin hydroxylase
LEMRSSRRWPRVVVGALVVSILLNLYLLTSDRDPQDVVDDFHRLTYDTKTPWVENKWFGVSALQNPNDAWVIQEIMAEVKPDFVIEAGTWNGGGALLWASILEQLNPNGRVITIDVEDGTGDAQKVPIWWRRVTFLHGRSTDPGIVRKVKQIVGNGKVLVILDSDHSRDNVLAELKTYGPLVSPGSYLIVQDTSVNGHPILPDFGPGPMEAVDEFVPEHPEFTIDRSRERLLFTMHPKGYLKKSAPDAAG